MLTAAMPSRSASATAPRRTRSLLSRSRRAVCAVTCASLSAEASVLTRCTWYTYDRLSSGVRSTPSRRRIRMTSSRRTAVIAGSCYLVTHVTSVAALVLYGPALRHPGRLTAPGGGTQVLLGGWLEVVLALA